MWTQHKLAKVEVVVDSARAEVLLLEECCWDFFSGSYVHEHLFTIVCSKSVFRETTGL